MTALRDDLAAREARIATLEAELHTLNQQLSMERRRFRWLLWPYRLLWALLWPLRVLGRRLWRGGGGGRLLVWLLLALLVAAGWFYLTLPDVQRLEAIDRGLTIRVEKVGQELRRGDVVANLQISLENMPEHLIQAFLAAEDRQFFAHGGVNWRGLARALSECLENAVALRLACETGGSGITQQLVKNIFLYFDRSPLRKLKEMALAWELERHYDKQEILRTYLNTIYLGHRAFGVEVAARRYFHKHVGQLNLLEAAILAGSNPRPARENLLDDPEAALRNARRVLDAMVVAGFIDDDQRNRALTRGWGRGDNPWNPIHVGDFWEWIKPELRERLGDREGTFVAVTTLNAELQLYAEHALNLNLRAARSASVTQGALLAMSPRGAVQAMVGGAEDRPRGLNRAASTRRQPGSVFKPVVYLAALEAGFEPDRVVEDRPIACGDWQPRNFDGRYLGRMTLGTSLALSRNTVPVRLLQELGLPRVVDTARRLGIRSEINNACTSALGTDELTLLETVGAYAVLANGGRAVQPFGLLGIRDRTGRFMFWRGEARGRRVVDPRAAQAMTRMLQEAVREGTSAAAAIGATTVAGKTGTTSAYRDAWFIGYTPTLVTGVWVGNDDNRRMQGVTGGDLPARIFRRFLTNAYRYLDFIAGSDGEDATP